MSTWSFMSTKAQSHSLTLVCHSDSIFSNFSSITARPIEAKFHMALPWDEGMEVLSNGLGHMTKLAAMEKKKKTSSSEPKGWRPWNLVCSIWYSSTTKFVQMITLGSPRHILRKVKFGPFCLCMENRLNCRLPRNWRIHWGKSRYI